MKVSFAKLFVPVLALSAVTSTTGLAAGGLSHAKYRCEASVCQLRVDGRYVSPQGQTSPFEIRAHGPQANLALADFKNDSLGYPSRLEGTDLENLSMQVSAFGWEGHTRLFACLTVTPKASYEVPVQVCFEDNQNGIAPKLKAQAQLAVGSKSLLEKRGTLLVGVECKLQETKPKE